MTTLEKNLQHRIWHTRRLDRLNRAINKAILESAVFHIDDEVVWSDGTHTLHGRVESVKPRILEDDLSYVREYTLTKLHATHRYPMPETFILDESELTLYGGSK